VELELLGIAGVAAFVLGGGAILLISAFRRTIELRGALMQAMRRIEKLEAMVMHLSSGRAEIPLETPAPIAAQQQAAQYQSAAVAELTPEAIPFRAQPRPSALGLTPAPAPAIEPPSPLERTDPPNVGVVAFIAAFFASAALIAAQLKALLPPAGMALALLVGLCTLGVAEWRRTYDLAKARPLTTVLPSQAEATALVGFIVILGASLFGVFQLQAASLWFAFAAAAAIALSGLWLGRFYGPYLAAFGLVAATVAPAMAPPDLFGPWAAFALLVATLALAMLAARARDASVWAWIAAAIGVGWALITALSRDPSAQPAAAGAFFALLVIAAAAYGWRDAREPLPFPRFWAPTQRLREPFVFAACLFVAAIAGLTTAALAAQAPVVLKGAALAALVGFSIVAAALKPGYWPAPLAAGLASAVAMTFWPIAASGLVDAPSLVVLAGLLAFGFAAGGAAIMLRGGDIRPAALMSGLGPILMVVAAHTRIGAFGEPVYWAAACAMVAGLNLAAYLQLMKSRPSAASAFSAGAALAVIAMLYVLTPADFAGFTLAASLPLLAFALRLREEAGLRLAALILCPFVFLRLIGPEIFVATASPPAAMALKIAPSLMACLLAGLMFDPLRARRSAAETEAAMTLALVLFASLITLSARHLATAGAIGGPYHDLVEMGLNTIVWTGVAAGLAARLGPKPRPFFFALELAVFAAASVHALVAGLLFLAPWWGLTPATPQSVARLSAIVFAFGGAAALFLGYAFLRARQNQIARANFAAGVGLTLAFAGLLLELRRLFHGFAMATAPMGTFEAWAYTLAGLGYAGLLIALAAERRSTGLAFVSLSLAVTVLIKAALFDFFAYDWSVRAIAFVLITALAAGLVWAFRRFVLGAKASAPRGLSGATPAA